ncbi:MAG: NlpC/P60 family protein [Agathobacter sp.]
MKFNELIKKRLGLVLAFSLVLSGGAVYAGVSADHKELAANQGENTEGLTAGVSDALRVSDAEALDVTAGVTDQLYDYSMVAVTPNQLETVGQGVNAGTDLGTGVGANADILAEASEGAREEAIAETEAEAVAGAKTDAGAETDADAKTDADAETENTVDAKDEEETICGYKKLGIAAVSEGNLNVRSRATTDSKAVGMMTKHAACEILGKRGDWYRVQSGKVRGFVRGDYLIKGDEALEIAKKEIIKVATVNTTTLRVREKASEDSPTLTLVGEGEDLVIEAEKNGWYKVEVDDQKGYISGDYVDISEKLPTAQSVKELKKGEGVSDSRVSLVQYALQFVGNPYVWGGTSLTGGIDCSGFTMQVYAHYGISLPHHAASQPAYGRRISASEAKPGDLFFYGSGSSIGHVGIYIGNGQIVHASNPRTGIKISSAYYRTPICVVSYL